MELYYHVIYFNRGEKCIFNFSFPKKHNYYITGCAEVNLATPLRACSFDKVSDNVLEAGEKKHIVNSVLKYIA